MSLSRRAARLEVLVQAQAEQPSASTFWTPERMGRWCEWANRLLGTMSYKRAVRVHAEMTTTPRDRWGPVACRLDHMASMGMEGHYDRSTWPHWADRAIALPDAVCEVLERHPDAYYTWDFSCEDCGLETPHRSGIAQTAAALMAICPLCTGAVRHCGYTHRRLRETWERQVGERAAH
jgi:hypothetical protein